MLKDFETGPNSPERIEQRYTTYRDLTLQLLLQGILEGEEMSKKSVYSFVSLWFENLEDEYCCFGVRITSRESVETIVKSILPRCPLHVFVPLAHQVSNESYRLG